MSGGESVLHRFLDDDLLHGHVTVCSFSVIITPVTYALSQRPKPTAPPRTIVGSRSRYPSAPTCARPNNAITPVTPPYMTLPETAFSREDMKRVFLNYWTSEGCAVRHVSALNLVWCTGWDGGVSRVGGTSRAYRALNSTSDCIPLRMLHGRQITWRLSISLDPPRMTGSMWSISNLRAIKRYPQ